MVKQLLIPILATALSVAAFSQEAAPGAASSASPQGAPLVETLPERIAFTKKFTYKQRPARSGDEEAQKLERFLAQMVRPADVDVTKTGDIRKERVRFTDNTSQERWRSGEYRFVIHSAEPTYVQVLVSGVNTEDENISDFVELGWVRHASFLGEQTKNGIKCAVYRLGEQTAWIEPGSRLPVYFESPTMQVSYRYRPTPTEALVLPERFAKRLEQVRRAWAGQPE